MTTPTANGPLDRVLSGLHARQIGHRFKAKCPAHEDRHASLSIAEGPDGRVLLKCFTGCATDRVVEMLGLTMADLFPGSERRNGRGERGSSIPRRAPATPQHHGCTLEQYATAKQLPVEELRRHGCDQITYLNQPAVRMLYMDAGGAGLATRYRIALEKTDTADDRFRWKSGTKPCLYGLWRLPAARELGYVVLVEGESDCHTLWHHGIPALGVPGAGLWNEVRDAPHLDGIPTVYVVREPDAGGDTLAARIGASRIRDRVRFVDLGDWKDPSGLHLADPDQFVHRWQVALDTAPEWTDEAVGETGARVAEAWNTCRDLALTPRLLDAFADELAAAGLVGERRAVQLLYLVLLSAQLDEPASAVVKGPSSAGKSYTVEKVLDYVPESAYYALSAMSERALAYSEEPLAHRTMVIYEAAGMAGDFATYLMRSLLSEGRVRYETVEKTRDGLKARLIEREGPTGLIVTTTAVKLHPENETRMVSIPTSDTPEQTRAVMRARAIRSRRPPDPARWHALYLWLAASPREVQVPYAAALADAIPPVAIRLRRDFGMLLTLIRTHALLHRAQRGTDGQGHPVATLADYAAVRELVHDLISEAAEKSVPSTVRETVAVVARLGAAKDEEHPVSVATLAAELKVDKSVASRRASVAVERGYLRNLEDKRGKPARLVLGDPLPGETPILPPADDERLLQCCTDDAEDKDTPPPAGTGTEPGTEPGLTEPWNRYVPPSPQEPQHPQQAQVSSNSNWADVEDVELVEANPRVETHSDVTTLPLPEDRGDSTVESGPRNRVTAPPAPSPNGLARFSDACPSCRRTLRGLEPVWGMCATCRPVLVSGSAGPNDWGNP